MQIRGYGQVTVTENFLKKTINTAFKLNPDECMYLCAIIVIILSVWLTGPRKYAGAMPGQTYSRRDAPKL